MKRIPSGRPKRIRRREDRMGRKTIKTKFILSMVIFGSVGLFVTRIELPSLEIAFFRSLIGSLVIVMLSFLQGKRPDLQAMKRNRGLLMLSGTALGLNWIFLFEAYKRTSLSSATLAYYMSPVILIVLSAFVFRVRITSFKALTILFSILGIMLILFGGEGFSTGGVRMYGILSGLVAAVLYALVVVMNKMMERIGGIDRTMSELMISCLVLGTYLSLRGGLSLHMIKGDSLIALLILGVVHTGIAYYLYFSSLEHLDTHYVALFSYMDPMTAMVLAYVFLGEAVNFNMVVGALLILGSSFLFEAIGKKENRISG